MDPLNSSCLICLEWLNLESSSSNFKSRQEICVRFNTSVSKFIQMNKKLDIDISQLNTLTFNQECLQMCCENCFISLEQFCKNYDQLQSLHKELLQLLYGIFLKKKTKSQNVNHYQTAQQMTKTMTRISSHPEGATDPHPGASGLVFNAVLIPLPAVPVSQDLSKNVKIEATQSLPTLPDVTTSEHEGHNNQYILPHPQDPLEDEANVVDSGQITITTPTPVPNILKRRRNANNPDEKRNGRNIPQEEATGNKQMKNPTLTTASKILDAVKKNRRFPQEKGKCYSSRMKIAYGLVHVDRSSSSVSETPNMLEVEIRDRSDNEISNNTPKPLVTAISTSKPNSSLQTQHGEEMAPLHPCRFCEKKFTLKQYQEKHIVTAHLGLKLFRCLHCDKKLTSEGTCQRHLRYVHRIFSLKGNIERKCDKCGQVFKKGYSLIKHIVSEHLPSEDSAHCDEVRADEGALMEVTGAEVVTDPHPGGSQGEVQHFLLDGSVFVKTEKPEESLEECFILPNTDC